MLDTDCSTCSSCTTHSAGSTHGFNIIIATTTRCGRDLSAVLFSCPRATAKDCLESSYFKEKPLREFIIQQLTSDLWPLPTHAACLLFQPASRSWCRRSRTIETSERLVRQRASRRGGRAAKSEDYCPLVGSCGATLEAKFRGRK